MYIWHDPLKLNSTPKNVEVKVFLDEDYSGFGSTFEEHEKYLPCCAIVQSLTGDCFYNFDLITDEGVIHSCGYAAGMKKYEGVGIRNMEDNFTLTIEWKNADVYFPELENEPIVYCTAKKKIGTIKSVKNQWEWLKEKYNIKWWCYQWRIVP